MIYPPGNITAYLFPAQMGLHGTMNDGTLSLTLHSQWMKSCRVLVYESAVVSQKD